VGYFGAKNFPQALISKSLQIICKVFEEIYTLRGYRGGGGIPPGIRGQRSEIRKNPRLWFLFML
jgi:hypothetical protein